ncbi:MAG TPA: sigma-70 family RNA polymerase sigma factor [Terriglobales bacterium]|nr:sigma-70 family RNA polymerase sigma factor [Terriglobales bacterium]
MPHKPAVDLRRLEALFQELFRKSEGEQYGLTAVDFFRILAEVGAKYLPASAGETEARALYESLRAEELALARGCAAGNERAWEVFLTRFRAKLYDAARAITRDDASGRELADSLYASLYGTEMREGVRVSKLTFYMGRGSLEGWLRTVLAQEYVNQYRKRRREVSLDEHLEQGEQFAEPATAGGNPGTLPADPATGADPRLEAAADEALASLDAEERFILASYYLDGRTLAQIARTLGVHESTISRKLEKLAQELRKKTLAALERRGMSRRQAEEALEADVRDLSVDVRGRLAQEMSARPFQARRSRE